MGSESPHNIRPSFKRIQLDDKKNLATNQTWSLPGIIGRDLEIIVLGHCSLILKFSSKISMTLSQRSLSNYTVYLYTYWCFYSSIWPLSQAQLWSNSPTTLADKPTDCLSYTCKFQKGGALCLSLPRLLFPLETFWKPSPPLVPLYFGLFLMFGPWLVLLLLLLCTAQLQLSTLAHGRAGNSKLEYMLYPVC